MYNRKYILNLINELDFSENFVRDEKSNKYLSYYEVFTQAYQIAEKQEFIAILDNCIELCEPQLGKRGLYSTVSKKGSYDEIRTMTNFIAYADGKNDLLDISDIIETPIEDIIPVIDKLINNNLIERMI